MNKLNRYYISQNISIDNALSMNQILHQIVNEIKGIVDFINNLELRANEYTDEQIRLLNEKLQAQLETLEDTLKTYTNDKIDEYNAEIINPQLIEIRNTIDTINRTINERIDREVGIINRHINSVESTLNKKIDDTKEYLEELIKKGNQLVYSSISGRKIPIQDTLFEMGNALKQILSYNWNSIDEFKTFLNNRNNLIFNNGTNLYDNKYGVIVTVSNFSVLYSNNVMTFNLLNYGAGFSPSNVIINGVDVGITTSANTQIDISYFNEYFNTLILKFINPGSIEVEFYIYVINLDYNSTKFSFSNTLFDNIKFTTVNGDTYSIINTNDNIEIYDVVGSPQTITDVKLNGNDIETTFNKNDLIYNVNILKITSEIYGSSIIQYIYIVNNELTDKCEITFNSLKLAMQELNVNWNALSFTGVNTFYELNETEKMYDTTGIKSDYFVDNKYKQVHNNFESDFFKSNIN